MQRSGSAIYSWASWMDAGTAQGVLHRFMTLSNPQRAVIAAWSHGARQDADPFHAVDHPLDPPTEAQLLEDLCFYRAYLGGEGDSGKELVYKTMGEDGWKRTGQWPLPETEMTAWYFREEGGLSPEPPDAGTFARIPAEGAPVWTVERSPGRASHIVLPVISR
jgi:predicted acyl esterase